MVTIEVMVAINWTRGKRDVVPLFVGQVIDVPDSVADSMLASGQAKRVQSLSASAPPPGVPEPTTDKPKFHKAGGK
jgi:hypothetical protein